jgi:hypothetical protein
VAAAGDAVLGDPVSSDDKQGAGAVKEDFLPSVPAEGVLAMGGNAAGEFRKRELGNSAGLMWAAECCVFAVGD